MKHRAWGMEHGAKEKIREMRRYLKDR